MLHVVLIASGREMESGPNQTNWPEPTDGNFIIKDYQFVDGGSVPELRIHYRTVGTPKSNDDGKTTNAILIIHGTTGSGANFFRDVFAGRLFKPGQLLSAEKYFLILPDGIGHGGSSKPSDGLHAQFPRYCYEDMVRAQHKLLIKHLDVNHLRLVMGTSMGGVSETIGHRANVAYWLIIS